MLHRIRLLGNTSYWYILKIGNIANIHAIFLKRIIFTKMFSTLCFFWIKLVLFDNNLRNPTNLDRTWRFDDDIIKKVNFLLCSCKARFFLAASALILARFTKVIRIPPPTQQNAKWGNTGCRFSMFQEGKSNIR